MRNYCDCEGSSLLELQTDALKAIIDALDVVEDDNAKACIADALVGAMHELNRATKIDIEDDDLYDEGYDDACIELGFCPDCMKPIEECSCGCFDDEEEDEGCDLKLDEDEEGEEDYDAYTEGYREGCFAAGVCPDCGKPLDECECGGRDEYEECMAYTNGYRDALKANGFCPDCGFPLDECICDVDDGAPNDPTPKE